MVVVGGEVVFEFETADEENKRKKTKGRNGKDEKNRGKILGAIC